MREVTHDVEDVIDLKSAADGVCPVCGEEPVAERCKVVCRSRRCVHRILFTCAEF